MWDDLYEITIMLINACGCGCGCGWVGWATINRLQVLDLRGCINVGEFGDHATKEIGAFCGQLRQLDLTGAKEREREWVCVNE